MSLEIEKLIEEHDKSMMKEVIEEYNKLLTKTHLSLQDCYYEMRMKYLHINPYQE